MAKFMVIAGEPSGDTLGAELVKALRAEPALSAPQFFGAGGPRLASAGMEQNLDLAAHAVVGIWEVLKNYRKFKRFFEQLLGLALERRPDAIILIDFPGFNLRFARELRVRAARVGWRPKLVYYVSPQIWAWHESRVVQIARDIDLMLVIFPFEKGWYERRAPNLRVEFVGHPLIGRHADFRKPPGEGHELLLLPGSRERELRKHLPVMVEAARAVQTAGAPPCRMVLPSESLRDMAAAAVRQNGIELQVGGLADALGRASVAIASSGTVTMECAFFRVPTVVLYKTSWSTHALGRRFIKVQFLAMPNLLADEEIYPEFIQDQASAGNLARAAGELLRSPDRRAEIRRKLDGVIATLGEVGASQRAAGHVARLLTC